MILRLYIKCVMSRMEAANTVDTTCFGSREVGDLFHSRLKFSCRPSVTDAE